MLVEALGLSPHTKRVLSLQSHVVHGYVGNKAAVFPLQLLGFDVDPVNSVQFSNHTGYPKFTGDILNGEQLWKLVEGLEGNLLLNGYSHVSTGYIGSPSFLQTVAKVVEKLRDHNSSVLYVCDPVLGDNGDFYNKSPNFGKEMVQLYRQMILPLATILTPNQFELEQLLGEKLESIEAVCEGCDKLHDEYGIGHVIVTSMFWDEEHVELLLSSRNKGKYRLKLPKIEGRFTGTGDLTSALLIARTFEHPYELPYALELVGASMQGVLENTTTYGVKRRYSSPRKYPVITADPPPIGATIGGTTGNGNGISQLAPRRVPDESHSDEPLESSSGVDGSRSGSHPVSNSRDVTPSPTPTNAGNKTPGGGGGPGGRELVTIPPEIRLIQSKQAIENPKIRFRCEAFPKPDIKVVVFDMDGTLTKPHMIDFHQMRQTVGVPKGEDILDFIDGVRNGTGNGAGETGGNPEKADRLMAIIEQMELDAMRNVELQPDCASVLMNLKAKGYKLGLVTRNHGKGVELFLDVVERQLDPSMLVSMGLGGETGGNDARETVANGGNGVSSTEQDISTLRKNFRNSLFTRIITRDEPNIKRKPSGDAVRAIGRDLGLFKEGSPASGEGSEGSPGGSEEGDGMQQILMVGDHADDVRCGKDAGALACELIEYGHQPFLKLQPDIVVSSLEGLLRYL